MLMVAVFGSLCTALVMFSIVGRVSKTWLKRMLGYEWAVDIALTLGMVLWFTGAGGITAILTSAVTGAIFSIVLYSGKQIIGYQKYEKVNGTRQWVAYPPNWTLRAVGGFIRNSGDAIISATKEIAEGVKAKPELKLVVNNAA